MNVEIGTEAPIFLFWEYFFQIFGILSLQCNHLFALVVFPMLVKWMGMRMHCLSSHQPGPSPNSSQVEFLVVGSCISQKPSLNVRQLLKP